MSGCRFRLRPSRREHRPRSERQRRCAAPTRLSRGPAPARRRCAFSQSRARRAAARRATRPRAAAGWAAPRNANRSGSKLPDPGSASGPAHSARLPAANRASRRASTSRASSAGSAAGCSCAVAAPSETCRDAARSPRARSSDKAMRAHSAGTRFDGDAETRAAFHDLIGTCSFQGPCISPVAGASRVILVQRPDVAATCRAIWRRRGDNGPAASPRAQFRHGDDLISDRSGFVNV